MGPSTPPPRVAACLVAAAALLAGAGARRVDPRDALGAGDLSAGAALVDLSRAAVGAPDAREVARAIKLGLEAVTQGIEPLKKTPPDIKEALGIFDEKLWKVVLLVSNHEKQNWDKIETARIAWDAAFKDLPSIYIDVQKFQSEGDTDALTRVISAIIGAGKRALQDTLPEVVPFLNAIDGMVQGMDGGWKLYLDGNIESAVGAFWKATHNAVDSLLPEELRTHETYQLVTGMADHVIGDLTKHVVDYKKAINEAEVCYKRRIQRGRARPSVCRPGFFWDGGHRCLPTIDNGADCFGPCGKRAGECPSFCGETKVCCKQGASSSPDECYGAVGYKDYSFTEGSSYDYHQCVYPVQPDDDEEDMEADSDDEDEGPELEFDEDDLDQGQLDGDIPEIPSWPPLAPSSGVQSVGAARAQPAPDEEQEEVPAIDQGLDGAGGAFLEEEFAENERLVFDDNEGEEFGSALSEVGFRWLPGQRRRVAFGATEAMCDMGTEFDEKHTNGRYCLTRCPKGFREVNDESCLSVCGEGTGEFKVDGTGICGKHAGATMQSYLDVITSTLGGLLNLATLVANVKEKEGVDASDFKETLETLIGMGKSFAKPMCPMTLLEEKPEDMHKTPVLFHITGAGDQRLNGAWEKSGWKRGRPRYSKVGHADNVMEWSDSRMAWRLFVDVTFFKKWGRKTLYMSSMNTMAFPLEGWVPVKGAEPAPTVKRHKHKQD